MKTLSFTKKLAYAAPAFALAVVGIPVYVYIPKFYTDVVGVHISALPARLTVFDYMGIMIWIAGFIIESTADYQLSAFIKNTVNKGKIMNTGLWRYSRHPNYFGKSLMWWGIFVIVLSTPWGIWTIISPLLITYTLLKLTGVTIMEETVFAGNPEYQTYVSQTSALVPWFSKKTGIK